jgi:hypothetical protein
MAFLIHGGPQGAWEDGWSTRWNPAVFANVNAGEKGGDSVKEERDGMGWVVVAINPTGSTGYGQNFTDAIQGNWGTIPCNHPCPYYLPLSSCQISPCSRVCISSVLTGVLIVDWDLEAGYDYLLKEYEFIDPERTVALGASYGGYMVISRQHPHPTLSPFSPFSVRLNTAIICIPRLEQTDHR